MRKYPGRWSSLLVAAATVVGVSACGPAVQPPSKNAQSTQSGVLDQTGWAALESAALQGESLSMYEIKTDVKILTGTMHSEYSVYGSVNMPDTTLLGVHEFNTNLYFYQQGLSAYAKENNEWTQTPAIANLDVFKSYAQIIHHASQAGIRLYRLPDAFVVDEFSTVYKAVLPSSMLQSLPLWGRATTPLPLGNVVTTFAVGHKDGQLREVTASSVGTLEGVSALQFNTDTVLFALDKPQAQVRLPIDLYISLIRHTN